MMRYLWKSLVIALALVMVTSYMSVLAAASSDGPAVDSDTSGIVDSRHAGPLHAPMIRSGSSPYASFQQTAGVPFTSVALVQDINPWGMSSNQNVLNAYSIPYTVVSSASFGNISLASFQKVIIASDQPQSFYNAVASYKSWFEGYASAGGMLEIHAADYGWNGGEWVGTIPGGITWSGGSADQLTIVDAFHPVVNTPHLITNTEIDNWGSSAHGTFSAIPAGAHVIIRDDSTSNPVYIEFSYGSGAIVATGQTLEYGYYEGDSLFLENSLLYDSVKLDHDLSVYLNAPNYLSPGDSALLNATVSNVGLNVESNVSLSILIDGAVVDSVIIPTLANGTSYTLGYTWTPTVNASYNVTASVGVVPGENNTFNNIFSTTVYVGNLIRVLVDQTHSTTSLSYFSVWINELFNRHFVIDMLTSTPVTASTLLSYSVFVIPQAHTNYTFSELAVIHNFVLNGGSLFVIGDDYAGIYTELSNFAGITWTGMYGTGGYASDITPHQVTDGVYSAYFQSPVSGLSVALPAESLIRDSAGNTMLAVSEIGAGKVVCLADDNCIDDYDITYADNQLLSTNIMEWLSTAYDHELRAAIEVPRFVEPDDPALLNATVRNNGLNTEYNVSLSLLIDGVEVANVTLPVLVNGTSYTLSYVWTPTAEGAYDISAYVVPVPDEFLTADNTATKTVLVRAVQGYVLIDQTHGTDPIAYYSTMMGDLIDRNYVVDTLASGPITASTLFPYTVFVIPQAHSYYNASEITAIQNFVLSGGRLFVIGDDVASVYTQITSFAGLTWNGMGAMSGPTTDITPHPVTYNVSIAYFDSPMTSIDVTSPAQSLIREAYGKTMVAVSEIGQGKIVCVADDNCIMDYDIGLGNNHQLSINIFDWLARVYAHDLRVSIDAPRYAEPNSTVALNAIVRNSGMNPEHNVSLSLLIDGVEQVNVVIPELMKGDSYVINQTWTPMTAGVYNVTAYAVPVPDENVTTDNTATLMVNVRPVLGYVLFDQTHANYPIYEYTEWLSDLLYKGYVSEVLTTGPVTASVLEPFDVFVVPSADYYFGADELAAIEEFVRGGQGLLVMGGYPYANSELTSFAGMTWDWGGYYGNTSVIEDHPVTEGVEAVFFGYPDDFIIVAPPAISLIEDAYGETLLAVAEIDAGAVVSVGDATFAMDYFIGDVDNLRLAENIIDWLLLDNPVISLEFAPQDPVVGEMVTFDASGSYDPDGTIVSFQWDFGDGTSGTGPVATHVYAESGKYTVKLVETDDVGQNSTKKIEVNVSRTTLDVQVVVGSLHFGGELAEFYILVSNLGKPIDADVTGTLYCAGVVFEDLSSSVETIGLGLYRIPYAVPAGASSGTYALVVDATYLSASGTSIGSFLVSQTLAGWGALLVSINGTVGTITTDVGTIMLDLDAIGAELQGIEDGVASIETSIGTLQADIDLIDANVTDIVGRIVSIDSAIGSIQLDISAINGNIEAINGTLVTVQTDLGLVHTDIASINAELAAFSDTMVTIQSSIGTITTSIADIQLKVIALNGTSATIQTALGTIEGKVTSMEGDVATIQTDLGSVKADVSDVRGGQQNLSIPLYVVLIVTIVVVVGVVMLISHARRKA